MFGGIFFARSKALLGVYPGIIRGIPQHGGIPRIGLGILSSTFILSKV